MYNIKSFTVHTNEHNRQIVVNDNISIMKGLRFQVGPSCGEPIPATNYIITVNWNDKQKREFLLFPDWNDIASLQEVIHFECKDGKKYKAKCMMNGPCDDSLSLSIAEIEEI